MTPLSNAKWEKFALGLWRGMNQAQAYAAAGYGASGRAAEVNASRLAKNPAIVARIAELKARTAEKVSDTEALTKLWVVERLMRNARIALGEEAVTIRKKAKESDAVVAMEVTMRDAAAANQALNLLGKEIGMFVDRSEVLNVVRDITDEPLTEQEWADRHVTEH